MANRRRRSNREARVSAGAKLGPQQQRKKMMKYGLGTLGSIAAIVVIVFAAASSSGSSGEWEQAPDFEFTIVARG